MRLTPTKLIKYADTGQTDRMGNRIRQDLTFANGYGTFSSWSVRDVELLGRNVTETNQKLLYEGQLSDVDQAEKVQVGNSPQLKITSYSKQGRWIVLVVEKWKS